MGQPGKKPEGWRRGEWLEGAGEELLSGNLTARFQPKMFTYSLMITL